MNSLGSRVFSRQSITKLSPLSRAVPRTTHAYHSYDHPSSPSYSETSGKILSAALKHVSTTGFSETSLRRGASDAGYLATSTNLFPRGAFDLVAYYLVTRRLALQDLVNDPETGYAKQWAENKVGVGSRVRTLLLDRLRMNGKAEIVHKWPEVSHTIPEYLLTISGTGSHVSSHKCATISL
jgi:ubiquinone biosynthesis protein COQ9